MNNVKPVYDLLNNVGIKTTKTVWVYPPRDKFKGGSLSDNGFKTFILWLRNNGFEIAFHGPGSGNFTRQETVSALELFNKIIGYYPKLHINHGNNPDCIYWGYKRFSPLMRVLYRLFFLNTLKYSGEDKDSIYFWGDICKRNIKYIRNRVFSGINTLRYDPYMPYKVKQKELYSNFWFSSSDGFDAKTFCKLTKEENIDRLTDDGGCCIIYTHFGYGFVDEQGKLYEQFKKNIEYLACKDAWFAPASDILDFICKQRSSDIYLSKVNSCKMDAKWLIGRLYRKLFMKV